MKVKKKATGFKDMAIIPPFLSIQECISAPDFENLPSSPFSQKGITMRRSTIVFCVALLLAVAKRIRVGY